VRELSRGLNRTSCYNWRLPFDKQDETLVRRVRAPTVEANRIQQATFPDVEKIPALADWFSARLTLA